MAAKRTICFYCIYEGDCKTFCDMQRFKPTAEIMANFPKGSTATWKHCWSVTRQIVYLRDKRKCHFCGKMIMGRNYEVHHLKRRQFKGTNHPRNLVTACKSCHAVTLAAYTEKLLVRQKQIKQQDKYWKRIIRQNGNGATTE